MGPQCGKVLFPLFFSCQQMVKFYLVITDVYSDIALKSYSQYKVNEPKNALYMEGLKNQIFNFCQRPSFRSMRARHGQAGYSISNEI